MSKNHVSIDAILKHRRFIQGIDESMTSVDKCVRDAKTVFDDIITKPVTNVSVFKRKYTELLDYVAESADRTYHYPLLAIEKAQIDGYTEKAVDMYNSKIVPALSTDALAHLNDTIDQYKFGDDVKSKIKDVVEQNMIADRILNNHYNIDERCDDIESVLIHANRLGTDIVAEQMKGYIDTYNIRPYQKMNLCLEEIYYVLGKNGIEYDHSAMVRSVVESFLLSDYEENRENYKKVLENNYCYPEEEVKDSVNVMDDNSGDDIGTIQCLIDEYIRVSNIPFEDLCTNIGGCSVNDLKINIGVALDFLWKCVNVQNISYEDMTQGINALFECMANKIAVSEELLAKEDILAICNQIDEYIRQAEIKSGNELYANDIEKVRAFLQAVSLAKMQFEKNCTYLYDRNNIDTMARLNTEATDIVSLQEFRKFRLHNLVKRAINLEKYLKDKVKSIFTPRSKKDKSQLKLKSMTLKGANGSSIVFGENYDIENYITEDGKVDICVAQYYYDEACEDQCHALFSSICKDFNKTIDGQDIGAYYIFNSNVAEVHLKENVCIQLTEEEQKMVDEAIDPSMLIYMESLTKLANMSDKIANINNTFQVICMDSSITLEQFEMITEALSYLQVPKSYIESVTERYMELRFRTLISESNEEVYQSELNEVTNILESYEPIDEFVPESIQLEALDIFCDILEAGIKKPNIKKAEIKKADASKDDKDEDVDDDDEDEEEEKELDPKEQAEEKKKIDDVFDPKMGQKSGFGKKLNALRLALKGLRAKFGDLGEKEKEASKNLDAGVEHLMKGMHDALVSNRREAIIKGSVIPSFSRCIKAGLAIAGISIFAGSIVPAAIACLGAFAISKRLTRRERMLLLDDIETELEVVEKELQLAESKNQLKKYRALLKYKKDLSRQYQRIKYNHRIGQDMLPGSATGVYKPGGD